ncbi:UDP-4-amino-4,6-dideoxy-N-acetyl-beta-L-altrosamine transaminase [Corallincola luteus]|uniref:UDP-4-amino-4, 6-dideoxy-N-acetyl-beta-L-altrosamine transaminase n=1 Tax=Corallincola luteus TaxID=1775177 RepID=A0ABY2AQ99_9GAMM|nr:UDP-4-amino-4,6-dideoxy-N-acetyl-beta-L-altrosamine transaminase [Corallincola luteus]TCI05370.1 UDP-4-amino-4,6-dideoxy-N-acetyl-beta-L-altrosamine transaminase [Corallincola luteus]
MIPYGRQSIDSHDIDAVVDVLKSDFLTQGPQVPKFERALAAYCNAKHAVAVNSATSALHIACLALELSARDLLWTSPNSFVASANCGRYCGADIDFVDIDPDSGNLSVAALEKKLTIAKANGRLPKVLVVVHFAGQPCDMREIHALCQPFAINIIEDASHAVGSEYQGVKTGSGQYSDITIFSFHPVKIITSAEGGMALTNDPELAKRMSLFRSHGVTRDPELLQEEAPAPWYYEQQELGFNYRMTELQAALGLSQMRHLDRWVEQRNLLAKRYQQAFSNTVIKYLPVSDDRLSAYHLFVICLPDNLKLQHQTIFEALRAANIGVNLHYMPIHLQPYYQALGFQVGDFPQAESYATKAISLPLYAELTTEAQDLVIETVTQLCEGEMQ